MNILDTSGRRVKWREAYRDRSCLFVGEMEIPVLEKGTVLFIHETDLAPYETAETFGPNRLQELEGNFGGNKKKAREVCERIAAFRLNLQKWIEATGAFLIIYSGDPPAKVEERNPRRAIETNIARLPFEQVRVLEQMLPQDIDPLALRQIAETCLYSVSNGRDMSGDLAGVRKSCDGLKLVRLKSGMDPLYLDQLPDDIRKLVEDCLDPKQQPSPETLLHLLPYLENLK